MSSQEASNFSGDVDDCDWYCVLVITAGVTVIILLGAVLALVWRQKPEKGPDATPSELRAREEGRWAERGVGDTEDDRRYRQPHKKDAGTLTAGYYGQGDDAGRIKQTQSAGLPARPVDSAAAKSRRFCSVNTLECWKTKHAAEKAPIPMSRLVESSHEGSGRLAAVEEGDRTEGGGRGLPSRCDCKHTDGHGASAVSTGARQSSMGGSRSHRSKGSSMEVVDGARQSSMGGSRSHRSKGSSQAIVADRSFSRSGDDGMEVGKGEGGSGGLGSDLIGRSKEKELDGARSRKSGLSGYEGTKSDKSTTTAGFESVRSKKSNLYEEPRADKSGTDGIDRARSRLSRLAEGVEGSVSADPRGSRREVLVKREPERRRTTMAEAPPLLPSESDSTSRCSSARGGGRSLSPQRRICTQATRSANNRARKSVRNTAFDLRETQRWSTSKKRRIITDYCRCPR